MDFVLGLKKDEREPPLISILNLLSAISENKNQQLGSLQLLLVYSSLRWRKR